MKGLIFTYAMTYGGAAVSLFNPYIGFLIYVCFAIIKPDALWYWSVPEGNYSRIVAIALLIGWALNGFGSWKFGRARVIILSLIGFLVCCVLSSFSAFAPQIAWVFTESIAKIVLPFVVGATLIDSVAKLKQLAWVIVLSQGFLALEFNLSYYDGFNRLLIVGFAGMEEKSVSVAMIAAASVAFFLAFDAKNWFVRILAFTLSCLMLHVPLFTFSRGGMLGLIAGGLVTFILLPKRPVHYLFFALVFALGLRLSGPEVQEQFQTIFVSSEERDKSAATRFEHWEMCWETMQSHPITGVGPRNWQVWVMSRYNWRSAQDAHNTWLQAGAELGFPGMLFLVSFYGCCAFLSWPYTNERKSSPELANLGRMAISGLSGFVVSSLFITLYGIETPYYIALIGVGVIKLSSLHPESSQKLNPLTMSSNLQHETC